MSDDTLLALMRLIVRGDHGRALELVTAEPDLAAAELKRGASRQTSEEFFFDAIKHHVYEGDTPLHIAAASTDAMFARALLERGARAAATNRRGAQPLHYAVDGKRDGQRETIVALVEFGADPNAADKNGTTPLLRAIRNRSAEGVAALLEVGADPTATNKRGSTAMQLATSTTGKSGSGSPAARDQQREIIRLLRMSERRRS